MLWVAALLVACQPATLVRVTATGMDPDMVALQLELSYRPAGAAPDLGPAPFQTCVVRAADLAQGSGCASGQVLSDGGVSADGSTWTFALRFEEAAAGTLSVSATASTEPLGGDGGAPCNAATAADTVTLPADVTLRLARPAGTVVVQSQRTLGEGSGTFKSDTPGVTCQSGEGGTVCSGSACTTAVIEAVPDGVSQLVGWQGSCAPGSASCTVALPPQGTTLTALFQQCSSAGWCAEASGTSDALNGVWGSAADDIWAVGNAGTLLHRDASGWTTVTVLPSVISNLNSINLRGVWGSGPQDVWVVGDHGTILRYGEPVSPPDGGNPDGGSAGEWSLVASGTTSTLRGVFGTGPSAVRAVGDNGTLLAWNGQAWAPWTVNQAVSTVNFYGAWISASGDAWAGGTSGTYVFDRMVLGIGFVEHPTLTAVSGSGSFVCFAALGGLAGCGVNQMFFKYAAMAAVSSDVPPDLTGVGVLSASTAWFVGSQSYQGVALPAILQFSLSAGNGSFQAQSVPEPTDGVNRGLFGIWASPQGDLWAVGDHGTILSMIKH